MISEHGTFTARHTVTAGEICDVLGIDVPEGAQVTLSTTRGQLTVYVVGDTRELEAALVAARSDKQDD